MKLKLFKCNLCGNIVAIVEESGVPIICCGQEMEEIRAGIEDASHEKHVPVYEMEGDRIRVRVGSTEHPMEDKHYIQWIGVETCKGFHSRQLKPGEDPAACFRLTFGDQPETVYAYCNLHGLWKNDCMEICGFRNRDGEAAGV